MISEGTRVALIGGLIMLIFGIFIVSIDTALAIGDWPPPGGGGSTAIDREILTISNCYNISLRVKQTEGVKVTPSFKDCTDEGSGYWSCDCHDTEDYNLIMRTDGESIDEDRYYDITLTYYLYDLNKEKNSFTVRDRGNDVSTSGENIEDLGKDIVVVEKPIYINQTVYQDRPVDRLVYVDKIVNIENLTKVKLLQENITSLQQELVAKDKSRTWPNIFLIISILVNAFFIYMWVTNK